MNLTELISYDAQGLEYYRTQVASLAAQRKEENPGAKKGLEMRDPETAARALYLLNVGGISKRRICQELQVDTFTLDRLIYRVPELWEKRRPMLAAQMTEAAGKLASAMEKKAEMLLEDEELLAATPLNHIAIAMGVSVDKAASMNGMATTVVEHRIGPSLDDAMSAIEAAKAKVAERAKVQTIEAEILE